KLYLGKVTGIQNNHKDVTSAKTGTNVCIKLENDKNTNISYSHHFDSNDMLYTQITRESINICKEYFKDELSKDDLILIAKLKKILNII
ncbi:MAG: eukaryotic translation initiation factor 5B-like protein, partial [Gaeavirus sp.]